MLSEVRNYTGIALAISLAGCTGLFDPSLYEALDPSKQEAGIDSGSGDAGSTDAGKDATSDSGAGDSGTGKDSGPDDGGGGGKDAEAGIDAGGPAFVDECGDKDTTVLRSSGLTVNMSTADMTNGTELVCGSKKSEGLEGWFAVEAQAGQRWHFHVDPQNRGDDPDQNPFVYVVGSSCDLRSCQERTSQDICGDKKSEHFTFEADSSGTWYVAIDDRNPEVGGDYRILAINTICGDGEKEHNESCDDGNTTPGDGCSAECRRELTGGNVMQDEPNDDWTTANRLMSAGVGVPQAVQGQVGAECDVDMYAVNVAEGQSIRAEVLATGGVPCTGLSADVSTAELDLVDADGQLSRGNGTANRGGNECQTIDPDEVSDAFATNLPAGLYYLRLNGQEDKLAFGYQLKITLE